MKKLKLNQLKLQDGDLLERNDLKDVYGGSGSGCCRVFVRSNGGSGSGYWSGTTYSVEFARSSYTSSQEWQNGYVTTGYCCYSCPQPTNC